MTVRTFSENIPRVGFVGLSTDTKPVAEIGSKFFETDTGFTYISIDGNASSWIFFSSGNIAHSLATAANDFIVASGVGVFIKKTLAEVKTILGLGTAAYTAATAYVTHTLATAANDFIVASGSGTYVKKTLAETQTIIFSTALPENVGIILDPSLSADDTYSPVAVEVGVAGAALTHGEVIYQAVADSKWEKAKADAITTSIHKLGMCCIDTAENGALIVLLIGKIRADAVFPTFTAYAPVYISAATAGALTSTCPAKVTGTVVRVVGRANSGDELWFNPSANWAVYA